MRLFCFGRSNILQVLAHHLRLDIWILRVRGHSLETVSGDSNYPFYHYLLLPQSCRRRDIIKLPEDAADRRRVSRHFNQCICLLHSDCHDPVRIWQSGDKVENDSEIPK